MERLLKVILVLWFRAQGRVVLIWVLMLAFCQMSCNRSQRRADDVQSTNQNMAKNERAEEPRTEELQLELKSDRTELGPGDCTDLRLDVFNASARAIPWSAGWVLEQEGPSPPQPDGIRSAVAIPPGKSDSFMTIRVCYANLVSGIYRFRIKIGRAHV